VPAKKTRQPGKGKAVYLLSADRKYRRLSLKKVSDRVKAVRRRKRVPKAATAAVAESPLVEHRDPMPDRVAAVAVAIAALILVTSLVGASWDSSPAEDTQVAVAQPAPTEAPVVLTADMASAPVIRATPPAPVPAPVPTPVPAAKSPAKTEASPAPAAVASPVPVRPTETPTVARVEVDAQPVATAASLDTVTISGCLDFDGKSAWLKDASGADAVQSRSWRSGFLKKRSPRIALVDGPISAEAYDGRRVSVTGVLVDREMRVSSLQPIADDCK